MNLAQRLSLIYIRTKFRILSAISARHAAERAFQLFCTPPTRDKKQLPELFRRQRVSGSGFMNMMSEVIAGIRAAAKRC
jgi:hypothetical protein